MPDFKLFIKKCASSCAVFLIFMSVSAAEEPLVKANELTYYSEIYPPMNYTKSGVAVGASVEMLEEMWKVMNIDPQIILIQPWARAYRNSLNEPNAVLFTMSRTQGREKLFKWVGPIISTTHILIARKDANIRIDNIEDSFNYRVATIQNDISELALLNMGFPTINMQKLTSLDQSIQMLNVKRVDMMLLTKAALSSLLTRHRLLITDFEIVFDVKRVDSYFAFNKKVPDSVINKFQKAFNLIEPQRIEILDRYQLN